MVPRDDLGRRRAGGLLWFGVLSVVVVVFGLVAWKWSEAVGRVRCVTDLMAKGVLISYGMDTDQWSSEWPFHNVQRIRDLRLYEGRFSDDDVRRLRKAFPGASIYSVDPEDEQTKSVVGFLKGKPVKLPEDRD